MSNNSTVTSDGGEIARSITVQAQAARVVPIAEFNPILLKPKGNSISQIMLMGQPYCDTSAKEYYQKHVPNLKTYIKTSLEYLAENYDLIIIEGAGSPAEINLTSVSISNMFVANMVNAPVILVADIDRGGVFASIYGTLKLLESREQNLVKSFVINKFRGDIEILKTGIQQIEGLVGINYLGVLPFIEGLKIPSKDSFSRKDGSPSGLIKICVVKLPRISNFTDFDPLNWEDDVQIQYVDDPEDFNNADLIIIPGSKNTIRDLDWMNKTGFSTKIMKLTSTQKMIVGICAGYQMLGEIIIDEGIEDNNTITYSGLGLLQTKTTFLRYEKIMKKTTGKFVNFKKFEDYTIHGYEIHMGEVTVNNDSNHFLVTDDENIVLGAKNHDNTVFGTLVHGFWDDDNFRNAFIENLYYRKKKKRNRKLKTNYHADVDHNINKFADHVAENLNIHHIKEWLSEPGE